MANKQIALQQVRHGKQRDLPNALEKGQLGFSTDVGRLFIGLPSSTDPASLVAGRTWTTDPNSGKENVEILTEFTPAEVINNIVAQPTTEILAPGITTPLTIRSKSRVFVDYVAYDSTNTILESGSVQLVTVENNVLIAQQNNSNQTDGIFYLTFLDPSYDNTTQRMTMPVQNSSTNAFTIEFIIRGWDKS